MQVLHIITGLNKGGAETLLCNLCEYDNQSKHIIISLTDIKALESSFPELNNISVFSLNFPDGRIKISGIYKLYRLIKRINPDIVQTWMIHADFVGGLAARLAGIRNIFWGVHHTVLFHGSIKWSTILILKFNALLSHFIPKKIVYCAEKSRSAQESIGFKKSIGIVIQNGYDVQKFTKNTYLGSSFREELKISDDTFVIGHVSRYDPLKDQNTLIEALDILKKNRLNFTAVLIGKNLDNDNNDLVRKIEEKGLSGYIHLLGERDDIPIAMNAIDLFVLSSISEAFPNVLNEAMACGIPCVTTNVGDAALIVKNTGWIVPPKNPKLISNAIIDAETEFRSRNHLWLIRKDECHKRINENFSLQKMIEKYKKMWSNNL
jgi:glycosyltransferase involved in cell wall biosynthesis